MTRFVIEHPLFAYWKECLQNFRSDMSLDQQWINSMIRKQLYISLVRSHIGQLEHRATKFILSDSPLSAKVDFISL